MTGDTLRSAADLGLPMVGFTLLHRKGYFFQRLNDKGSQHQEAVAWPIDDFLSLMDATCQVELEGYQVTIHAWRYPITGVSGAEVPVFLLDTDVPGNDPFDRTLIDYLYGGDGRFRLCQEVILGVGGVRLLRALGYAHVGKFPWPLPLVLIFFLGWRVLALLIGVFLPRQTITIAATLRADVLRAGLVDLLSYGGGVTPVGLLAITKDKEVRVVAAQVGVLSEVPKAAIPEILEFMRGKGREPKGGQRGEADPLGVIGAYRLVKEEMPRVQLAPIGAMAGDDPNRLSEMAGGLH